MNLKIGVIKKNQILTWSVIIMLVVAGFLNYENDPASAYDVEVTNMIDENLGDAVFVDSSNLVTNIDEIVTNLDDASYKTTSAEYFSESRITRNNSYAEQIEMYQKIVSSSALEEQRKMASDEIKRINDEKNAISIAENLIKLKGIEEVVIFVNNDSVNVVIQNDKVDDACIAKVQNIIQNELNVEVKKIHINNFESK